MIILDTNVISELLRPQPAAVVVAWLDELSDSDVATTAITAAELLYGVERLPDGQRKTALTAAVQQVLTEDFDGRVEPFDHGAARHYAPIVAERDAEGQPISNADAQIASICRRLGATVATRNVKDFKGTGIAVIDPWEGA